MVLQLEALHRVSGEKGRIKNKVLSEPNPGADEEVLS